MLERGVNWNLLLRTFFLLIVLTVALHWGISLAPDSVASILYWIWFATIALLSIAVLLLVITASKLLLR